MDTPISYWKDEVDIAATTPLDFENRSQSANVYDPHGLHRTIGQRLAAKLDTTHSIAWDFALRCYLAALCDEGTIDCRERYNQTRLIPPYGWLDANSDRLPTIDGDVEPTEYDTVAERQFSFQTTETIYAMVSDFVDEGCVEKPNEILKRVMAFVVNGYEIPNETLEELLE